MIALPEDEVGVLFGEYILNENTDGEVTSVDLMFDAGDLVARVARLTNVVVTETAGELSATFDVELTLPEDIQTCENSLPGSVTAPKEEPVEEALTANAVSNHALLIGEWIISYYQATDGENLQTLLGEICEESNESNSEIARQDNNSTDCQPASSAIVNFSDFGTYSLSLIAQNGMPLGVEVGGWHWDNGQTTFVAVSPEDDYEENPFEVVSLDESQFIMRGTHTNYDIALGTGVTPTYSGVFDGTSFIANDNGNNVYNFPSGAQSWAGFANEDASIYPLTFPYGGRITFTGSAAEGDVELFFKFEYDAWPNVDPAFETNIVTVSGSEERTYTLEIPAQGPSNTYSSALLYLISRDTNVTLKDFSIQPYVETEMEVTETFTFSRY